MYMTSDSTFVIWDVTKEAEVMSFKYDGEGRGISSDGASIASHSGRCIKIWHTDIMSQNHDIAGHSTNSVFCVAFSGDGRFIASGSEDTTVRLWDPNSGLCLHTFRGHSGWVERVTFSPDSRFCASASDDNTTRIWDVYARAPISVLDIASDDIIFSPDSSRFLSVRRLHSADYSTVPTHVILCEVEAGKSLAEMKVVDGSASFVFDIDGTIRNVSVKDGSLRRWRISPAPSPNHGSSIDDNENVHSSLPMVFVPVHDEQQQSTTSVFPAITPPQYKSSFGEGWIKDKEGRWVLWIPPDLRGRSDCYEKKVVIGSEIGKVTIVHFLDDHYGHSI
jgi:WD40 repeat protein